jgi:3-hydroxyisobutyrate dehydrogenase-like beta-hydroxyacid dehydrogenase
MASSDAANGGAQPSSLKVGFAGLGIMGTGMARNLLKSGLFASVSVWNRSIAKVGWLGHIGKHE